MAEMYLVDDDPRNADRTQARFRPVAVAHPTRVYTPSVAPAAPTYAAPTYASGPFAPNTGFFPQNQFWGGSAWGGNPIYAQPPTWGNPYMGMLGGLFGRVNVGQLVELVGAGFAALKSLPTAPVSTGDVTTDVANLVTYQQAIAEHGKLDEQIRTGASIIAKLLGA
jgi:hypothetical protein